AERGEESALREAHSAYYAELAERWDAVFYIEMDNAPALRVFDAEDDNLQAALGWPRQTGASHVELRFAAHLTSYLRRRGRTAESRTAIEHALARHRAGPPDPHHAEALSMLGSVEADSGNAARAAQLGAASLAEWRELGDERRVILQIERLGVAAALDG